MSERPPVEAIGAPSDDGARPALSEHQALMAIQDILRRAAGERGAHAAAAALMSIADIAAASGYPPWGRAPGLDEGLFARRWWGEDQD